MCRLFSAASGGAGVGHSLPLHVRSTPPVQPEGVAREEKRLGAPQVRATIKAGSRSKRAVAGALLGASLAHVRARRLTGGVDLRYARQPPPALALMWAVAVAAATYPLHRWAVGQGWVTQ
jgi:hypothetical protein